MYSYIKGEITEIKATNITIETYGIGYFVKVPNPYSFTINTNTTIYIHQHVKEDGIELYGFANAFEKETFEKLISVKGLGPKGALAILASSSPEEIIANINQKNASFVGTIHKLKQQCFLMSRRRKEREELP